MKARTARKKGQESLHIRGRTDSSMCICLMQSITQKTEVCSAIDTTTDIDSLDMGSSSDQETNQRSNSSEKFGLAPCCEAFRVADPLSLLSVSYWKYSCKIFAPGLQLQNQIDTPNLSYTLDYESCLLNQRVELDCKAMDDAQKMQNE